MFLFSIIFTKREVKSHLSCKIVATKTCKNKSKRGGQDQCRNAVDHIKIFDNDYSKHCGKEKVL